MKAAYASWQSACHWNANCCCDTSSAPRAFVHADLAILSGRPLDTRRELSASVLAVLQAQCSAPAGVHLQLSVQVLEIEQQAQCSAPAGVHLQLSVQVLEIERDSYAKVSVEAHG